MKEEIDETVNIDLSKYWCIFKRHRKAVALWAISGFVVGCIFALATPKKYTCLSKLAPELSSTATSRLSSVASMIGFSSSVLGTTDAVYPMVYPELVHSPEFIVDLFDMPVDFFYKNDSVHTNLYDYMDKYHGRTVVGDILFAPMNLMGVVMGKLKGEDEDYDRSTACDPFRMTNRQGRIYKDLCRCIEAEIDKKTLVVTVRTSLDNRFVCADLSREVNKNLKSYVTRYRTGKAIHDRDYYKKICEQSQSDYLIAQDRYSRYVDSHQGVILQRVNAERDRLKNEAGLKYQLYSTNAQQLQSADAKVQLETPVFAEIVTPTTPIKSVNSRKKTALALTFVGFLLGTVTVIVRNRNERC